MNTPSYEISLQTIELPPDLETVRERLMRAHPYAVQLDRQIDQAKRDEIPKPGPPKPPGAPFQFQKRRSDNLIERKQRLQRGVMNQVLFNFDKLEEQIKLDLEVVLKNQFGIQPDQFTNYKIQYDRHLMLDMKQEDFAKLHDPKTREQLAKEKEYTYQLTQEMMSNFPSRRKMPELSLEEKARQNSRDISIEPDRS